jgi:hypothetical protein
VTGGPVRFDLTGDEKVQEVFKNAPRSAYRHLREYLYQVWSDHRKQWRNIRAVKFTPKGRGVKVYKVGESGPTYRRTVHYDLPKDRRARSLSDAIKKLQNFSPSEIRTGSDVLEHHQDGGTVSSRGKRMPIPIRTRPADPREWRAQYPNKRLRFLKGRNGNGLVFEETRPARRGRPAKLRLRWVLSRKVRNKPKLRFYETWTQLARIRDRKWALAAEKMITDMETGRG